MKKYKKKKPRLKAAKKHTLRKKFLWLTAKLAIVSTFSVSLILFLMVLYYSIDLPDITEVYKFQKQHTFTVLDRNGKILANYGDLYGRDLTFQQIPPLLVKAVVATEDRRFFTHSGIDVLGIIRAIYKNQMVGKVVQGGSTITQQLAKIAFLTPERTFKRKIQEAILAVKLEKMYSKEEIIRIYLNRVYLGKGNFGIDAATKFYFGKRIDQLTLYEAAILAGMLKAPTKYAPSNNHLSSLQRAKQVLINMEEEGYITPEQIKQAIPPTIIERGYARGVLQNPYFTDYIMEILPLYITNLSQDINIYTTLSIEMQQNLEQAIIRHMNTAKKTFNAENAAAIAINKKGEIVAMVGGVSYIESQFNRAVNAKRQPGSAFKLFVYLAALENGLEPHSILEDSPIKIGRWSPRNFNRQFAGEVTLEEAFAKSINTVAVKISENIGRAKVIEMARRLGMHDKLKNVPSIALGSEVTSLLSLTAAYAVVANHGVYIPPFSILKITNKSGVVLYKHQVEATPQAISYNTLKKIKQLLAETVKIGTGHRAYIEGAAIYGKTGTTQDYRDASFIGFTDGLTVGVWVGNDDNTPMKNVMGGALPAKIWREFMIHYTSINHNPSPDTIWSNIDNKNAKRDLSEKPPSTSLSNFISSLLGRKTKPEQPAQGLIMK